ncbi:MAG TPA: CvpA family protein [Deltaproteobacteria bacterium]|nr:CvpA family protein [Deltaproteobacteria bacterium]HOI08523.1 CvpA family protein [Deltaproteobacteria bacterium]
MNSLDALFLIVCLGFLGLGFAQGLIRNVSSLVAIIAGLVCAKKLEPFISRVLAFVHIDNPKGALGYLFVFFCIFIAVKLLLLVLQKMTKASGLSIVDRTFGGLLGLVKGVIIVAIVGTLLQIALPGDSAVLKNSKILPYSNKVVARARVVLPNAVYQHVAKKKPLNIQENIQEKIKEQVGSIGKNRTKEKQ